MKKRYSSLYYNPPKLPQLIRSGQQVSVGKSSHPQLRPSIHKPFINAAYLECYDPLVPVNGRPTLREIPMTLDKRAQLASQPEISQQLDWYISYLERNIPQFPHLTAKLRQAKTYRSTAIFRPSIQLPRQEMTKSAMIRRAVHRSLFYTTGSCFSVLPGIERQQYADSRIGYYDTWKTMNSNISLSSQKYGGESQSEVQYLSTLTTADQPKDKITEETKKVSAQNSEEDRLYSAFSLASSVCKETGLPFSSSSSRTTPSRFDIDDYGYV